MQPARLILTRGDRREQEFALDKADVAVGRAEVNDIVIRDPKASRAHARLEFDGTAWAVADLGSANGTRVNDRRVQRAVLAVGDVIAIGDQTLRFELGAVESEPDVTLLQSERDLDATLAQQTVVARLSDTGVARIAVHMPGKTWEVPLNTDSVSIGRLPDSGIAIDHAKVSRQHARIERRGVAFVIRDLNSTNGTFLGDERISEHTLREGDTVRVGTALLVFKERFVAADLTLIEAPQAARKMPRRPVVIVPGFMGSELWRGSERVWANPRQFLTHPEIYRLSDDSPLEARGVLNELVVVPNLVKLDKYARLGDYLQEGLGYERGKDLLEFGYDWRRDNRESARRLGEAIERWDVKAPVIIIAHSMGCLVSRYYVERLGGKPKVERLILMGGPHQGVPKMISGLIGKDTLPFGLMGDKLREVLASFAAAYQILPTYACVADQHGRLVDVLSDETWLPDGQRPLLRDARKFRQELGTHSSVPCVSIFGYGQKTITRIDVRRGADGRWTRAEVASEPAGDNTIPEPSAIVPASEIHPVQQYHGTLFVDNDVRMRLKLELTKSRLP